MVVDDKVKNNKLFSDKITYFKNEEKIITEGKTQANIEDKYEFKSSNMTYFKNENLVSSKEKSSLIDKNSQLYTFSKFNYSMNETLLKAENITITTNYNKPASDKFFFQVVYLI